jgi:hypothetical protein
MARSINGAAEMRTALIFSHERKMGEMICAAIIARTRNTNGFILSS